MKPSVSPEPSYAQFSRKELTLGGVAYRLTLFAPRTGESNVNTRLKRLMKAALTQEGGGRIDTRS